LFNDPFLLGTLADSAESICRAVLIKKFPLAAGARPFDTSQFAPGLHRAKEGAKRTKYFRGSLRGVKIGTDGVNEEERIDKAASHRFFSGEDRSLYLLIILTALIS
jgi:hypothetical protein